MKFRQMVLASILFLGGGVAGWRVERNQTKTLFESPQQENITTKQSTINKYGELFDITIPYLREKKYRGSEIELGDVYQENSAYTSYLVKYNSEGLIINALLTKPKNEEPVGGFPAVVFLHGYIRPKEYVTTERYINYVDYLAKNGLVVVKIDFRGHGESEGIATGSYFNSGYVIDTLNAVASVRQLNFVNADKVGLWGHSMSGNVLLRSMVVDKSIKAGVIWAGAVYSYTDLMKYRINDNSYVRNPNVQNTNRSPENIFEQVGPIDEENDFWNIVAPTSFLSADMGAIQLHHAKDDKVVNVGYSLDLVERLKQAGVDYELNLYESGGHNLVMPAFSSAMKKTVDFLKI